MKGMLANLIPNRPAKWANVYQGKEPFINLLSPLELSWTGDDECAKCAQGIENHS